MQRQNHAAIAESRADFTNGPVDLADTRGIGIEVRGRGRCRGGHRVRAYAAAVAATGATCHSL